MAALTPEQQTFIVAEFARNKGGGQIVKSVKKEFAIELDRQQIWHYHPDNPKLADKWVHLYRELRSTLIEDVLSVAGAHQGFRLRELMKQYWKADEFGNIALCAELLEQMAKEVGEVFTNKRNININPQQALADLLGVPIEDLPEGSGK